jgi:hypothetical protein
MGTDSPVTPDGFDIYHAVAGEVLSQRNTYEFHNRSGGNVFSGSGATAYTFFDTVVGGEIGTSLTTRGLYYNNGFYHYLDGSEVSTKELPDDFCGFWFDGTYKEFKFKFKSSADFLTYVRSLSYEDWSHFPGVCALDGTYPTSRIVPVEDSYSQKVFAPGRPIYSILEDGVTLCHGIVTAAASNGTGGLNVDVAGYVPSELEGHDAQSYRYGDFSRVVTERFFIPGVFALDSIDTLLATYLNEHFIWKKGKARIVQISTIVGTKDSGANQPRVNVTVKPSGGSYHKVGTSNGSEGRDVNTSWVHTVDDIDGPVNGGNNYNRLDFNSEVEITTDAHGSNGDAADLTVIITAVLE